MKILRQLGTIKCILIATSIILLMVYFLMPDNSQNHYDFPLTKTSVENALKEVDLNWDIIDEDSIDEGNSNFRLSDPEHVRSLIIASMKKDEMLSFGIMPPGTNPYESAVFDDAKRKQILHLACELTEIKDYYLIYWKFNEYLADRDSRKYGNTTWHYRTGDKVLTISAIRSPGYINKYQIASVQVKNTEFFKESKKIIANYTTQNYLKHDDPVYKYVSLREIKRDISEGDQSIARIVIVGNVTNVKEPRVKELDGFTLEDSDYSLYAEDYRFAYISDGTDTIEVLLPKYIVDLSLITNEKKEWHITYHPSSDVYVVDYGIDTH